MLPRMLPVSPSGDVGSWGVSGRSFRGKNITYALTNAEALNFGKQTGSHEAAAELLRMDGE